jgi:hypothetical protein
MMSVGRYCTYLWYNTIREIPKAPEAKIMVRQVGERGRYV